MRIACRSISAIVIPGMRIAPDFTTGISPMGRCSSSMSGPSQSTTARSMAFSISRTFPGQRYESSFARASSLNPSMRF